MIDWRHWHNEPHLIGGLVLLAWLYALATGPLRVRLAPGLPPVPGRVRMAFYGGLVLFYLAVGSPLDQAGERFLFSAHMVQHLILTHLVAILFILGLPAWLTDDLPPRSAWVDRPVRLLLNPLVVAIAYNLTLGIWHVPALYDLALQDRWVHITEHVTFFGAAVLMWWPVFSRSRRFPPLAPGVQMLYLIGVTILGTPLFAYLAFSSSVLYPTYEFAPRIIAGFTAAQDQLLGAVIMKLGTMAVTFLVLIRCFYIWYLTSERKKG
ncbi:MAG: cytochrome c oxidase assembly protein [Verrucomicrobiota bacterium]